MRAGAATEPDESHEVEIDDGAESAERHDEHQVRLGRKGDGDDTDDDDDGARQRSAVCEEAVADRVGGVGGDDGQRASEQDVVPHGGCEEEDDRRLVDDGRDVVSAHPHLSDPH